MSSSIVPEDYVCYKTNVNEEFKTSEFTKAWVTMGKLVKEEDKDAEATFLPLGDAGFLQYSIYHRSELPNVKTDETEQKDKYIRMLSIDGLPKTYDLFQFQRAVKKNTNPELKPYYVQQVYYRMQQICGTCGPIPPVLAAVEVYPVLDVE